MIKGSWFKTYTPHDQPETWNFVFQSWDTANKPTELSDYSVCTTWGVKKKDLYLLNVYRKRVDYPTLKRAVIDQAGLWGATIVLIEDKGSGTPLIQDLIYDGMYGIKPYELPPGQDKITRMHSASSMIENGFVYLPEKDEWLSEYLHELKLFPHGKHDDQVDSTSQALDWMKRRYLEPPPLTITTVQL